MASFFFISLVMLENILASPKIDLIDDDLDETFGFVFFAAWFTMTCVVIFEINVMKRKRGKMFIADDAIDSSHPTVPLVPTLESARSKNSSPVTSEKSIALVEREIANGK